MCKHMAREINENRRDIIEIKASQGLSVDTYHELPEFDDRFVEWDVMDAAKAIAATPSPIPAAPVSSSHPRRSMRATYVEEEEEEDEDDNKEEEDEDYDNDEELLLFHFLFGT